MTRRVSLILVSVAMALGIAVPAQATPLSPRVLIDYNLCLESSPYPCFVANGSNQAIVRSSGYSTFNVIVTSTTYQGNPVYAFEDLHGNCIRGGQNNEVKVYPCDYADDPEQKWVAIGNTFENYGHLGNYLGTFGTADYNLVYYQGKQTGFYTGWILRG